MLVSTCKRCGRPWDGTSAYCPQCWSFSRELTSYLQQKMEQDHYRLLAEQLREQMEQSLGVGEGEL